MSASSVRGPSVARTSGTRSAPRASSMAPSWARNGGTTLSQAAPSVLGRRQRLDRFQVRTWTAGAVRGIPASSSTASAHARSSAGPPGRAHEARSGSSGSSRERSHVRTATSTSSLTSARYVTGPPQQDRCGSPASNRRMTTSMSCAWRAPTTTDPASCHHGTSTSNGARAPRIVPSRWHSTRVTTRLEAVCITLELPLRNGALADLAVVLRLVHGRRDLPSREAREA